MRALLSEAPGGPETLKLREVAEQSRICRVEFEGDLHLRFRFVEPSVNRVKNGEPMMRVDVVRVERERVFQRRFRARPIAVIKNSDKSLHGVSVRRIVIEFKRLI